MYTANDVASIGGWLYNLTLALTEFNGQVSMFLHLVFSRFREMQVVLAMIKFGKKSSVQYCHSYKACNLLVAQIYTLHDTKGLSNREAGRGHATPPMPVEMAKCW